MIMFISKIVLFTMKKMKSIVRYGLASLILLAIIAAVSRDDWLRPAVREFYYAKLLGTPIIQVLPRVEVDCGIAGGSIPVDSST